MLISLCVIYHYFSDRFSLVGGSILFFKWFNHFFQVVKDYVRYSVLSFPKLAGLQTVCSCLGLQLKSVMRFCQLSAYRDSSSQHFHPHCLLCIAFIYKHSGNFLMMILTLIQLRKILRKENNIDILQESLSLF